MALIEREEALRDLEGHEYSTDCELEDDKAWARGFNAGIAHARHHLIYQSAVDAEHVVHSHWEVAIGYDSNKKVQCQNCFLMAHEPTSRCPHCGAHMDEEVDNGTFG